MKNKFLLLFVVLLLSPIVVSAAAREGSIKGEYGTYDNAVKYIQEVMKDYYIREDNIQYNYSRAAYGTAAPEEATTQDNKHFVCGSFTYSVYAEAFGVSNKDDGFPVSNNTVLSEGSNFYNSNKNNSSALNGHYLIYYENKTNNTKYVYQNKTSINDFAKMIQPGDLFAYSGHAMMAYKVVERSTGKWDVLMLHSNFVHGVKTRIEGTSNVYYDFFPSTYGTNSNLKVSKEGTVKYFWLSEKTQFFKNGQLNCAKNECTVIRPFYKGSNNKAVFNYSILPANYNKTKLRAEYPGLYIAKTVDKQDNNSVYLKDKLKYTITIKNKSTSTGSGTNYGKFYIVEDVGSIVDFDSSNSGEFANGKITFEVDGLDAGQTKTLTYTVSVKNNLNYIGKTITSKGEFKKDLNSSVSISTGLVENTVIPTTKNKKKEYSVCYDENKASKKGLALIDSVYNCAYEKDFNFDEFSFTNLFTKKTNNTQNTSDAISFNGNMNNKSKLFKKMILNNLWSGTVEYHTGGYTFPRWSGTDAGTRARNINLNFFKEGDVLIYSVDYSNTLSDKRATKENGIYAFIFINGKFVGVNGSGTASRNEFTYKYYQDKSLDINTYLFTGYSKLTDSYNKDTILTKANYISLFDKDYYVILRPEMVIQETVKIKISKKPDKVVYHTEDNSLDLTGGEITIYYNDGTSKVVEMSSSGVTATGYSTTNFGNQTITVGYDGFTTSYTIKLESDDPGQDPGDDPADPPIDPDEPSTDPVDVPDNPTGGNDDAPDDNTDDWDMPDYPGTQGENGEELVPIPDTASFKNKLLTVIAIMFIGSGICIVGKNYLSD